MEENKYYTPKIEEFRIGFEYEEFYNKWEKKIYNGYPFLNDYWFDDLWSIKDAIESNSLRVKYLDLKDIEELGWIENKKYDKLRENKKAKLFYLLEFDKIRFKKIGLIYISESHYILIFGELSQDYFKNDITLFTGTIKNKSELKVLMKQLRI